MKNYEISRKRRAENRRFFMRSPVQKKYAAKAAHGARRVGKSLPYSIGNVIRISLLKAICNVRTKGPYIRRS